jgi:simple sugar transport system permease protein
MTIRRIKNHLAELHLFVGVLLICTILTLSTQGFGTVRNLVNVLTSYTVTGILAAGLMVVLVSGSIDISFAATASVSQYIMMTVLLKFGGNWLSAFGVSVGVGILLGSINAVLVHFLRASSIIVTIATLNVFYGLLIYTTGGQYIFSIPGWFSRGITMGHFQDTFGREYPVSLGFLSLAGSFLLSDLIMHRSVLGYQIYALGGSPESAQRLGLPIFRLRLFAFGYMGLMSGIAGLIQAQIGRQVDPTALSGIELDVLAAVVLGGVSLQGGTGTVLGTMLGIALLACMKNGLILLGFSNYWSQAAVGAVILVSVSSYALQTRRIARG